MQPRTWRASLVAIFVAAATLRLLYLLSIHQAYFFTHLQTEPLRYHRWATLILDSPRPPPPPFDEPPGYPYFLASVYRTVGRSVIAVALVQVILDALTCTLVALVGRRWFDVRIGILAGALAAAYGPLVYFTGSVEPATLFVCTVALALAVTAGRRWLASGGLWALALLVRVEVALAFPLVLLDAWRRGGRIALARIAAPLVVLITILATVNLAHTGKPVLYITSGGLNFWAGNDPWADGVNPFFSGPRAAVAREVAAQATDASNADRLFLRHALAFWRAEPGTALALVWKKFLWTFADRELPNTGDIEWQKSQSWLFRLPAFPLRFGVLLPVALVGALRLGRRWRELPLLAAPVAVAVGAALVFFTNARLRLVMTPSLVLLAALAVDDVARTAHARRRRDLVVIAAGLAGGILLAWGGFYGVSTYSIPEITVNTGLLERQAGHLASAIALLRDGVLAAPDDALAWSELGLALEEAGDRRAALESWLDGLARQPGDRRLGAVAAAFCRRHAIDPTAIERYVTASTATERQMIAERLLDAAASAPE